MGTQHVCAISGKPINKNHESYRGRMTQEMIAAIRKDCPGFHPKDDIHKEVGQKYYDLTHGEKRKPAWMKRPLG